MYVYELNQCNYELFTIIHIVYPHPKEILTVTYECISKTFNTPTPATCSL